MIHLFFFKFWWPNCKGGCQILLYGISDTFQCQYQLIYPFTLSLSFIIINVVYAVVELLMSHLYVEMKQ